VEVLRQLVVVEALLVEALPDQQPLEDPEVVAGLKVRH
jgi:hypothetical protein